MRNKFIPFVLAAASLIIFLGGIFFSIQLSWNSWIDATLAVASPTSVQKKQKSLSDSLISTCESLSIPLLDYRYTIELSKLRFEKPLFSIGKEYIFIDELRFHKGVISDIKIIIPSDKRSLSADAICKIGAVKWIHPALGSVKIDTAAITINAKPKLHLNIEALQFQYELNKEKQEIKEPRITLDINLSQTTPIDFIGVIAKSLYEFVENIFHKIEFGEEKSDTMNAWLENITTRETSLCLEYSTQKKTIATAQFKYNDGIPYVVLQNIETATTHQCPIETLIAELMKEEVLVDRIHLCSKGFYRLRYALNKGILENPEIIMWIAKGYFLEKKYPESLFWFKRAALAEAKGAGVYLSYFAWSGLVDQKNIPLAEQYALQAITEEDPPADGLEHSFMQWYQSVIPIDEVSIQME